MKQSFAFTVSHWHKFEFQSDICHRIIWKSLSNNAELIIVRKEDKISLCKISRKGLCVSAINIVKFARLKKQQQ